MINQLCIVQPNKNSFDFRFKILLKGNQPSKNIGIELTQMATTSVTGVHLWCKAFYQIARGMIGHMSSHQVDKAENRLIFRDIWALNEQLSGMIKRTRRIPLETQSCLPEGSHERRQRKIKQKIRPRKSILHHNECMSDKTFEIMPIAIEESFFSALLIGTGSHQAAIIQKALKPFLQPIVRYTKEGIVTKSCCKIATLG